MDKTLVYQYGPLIKRINNKLKRLNPTGEIVWSYKERKYYILLHDSDNTMRNVRIEDLLAFATFINLWKPVERPFEKYIKTNSGLVPEGRLRHDLEVYNFRRNVVSAVKADPPPSADIAAGVRDAVATETVTEIDWPELADIELPAEGQV